MGRASWKPTVLQKSTKDVYSRVHNLASFHTDQVSWPSSTDRNWLEARLEIQARFNWGPLLQEQEGRTAGSLARPLPKAGWTCSLYGIRIGYVSRCLDQRSGLGILPTCLVVVCSGACPDPAFAPNALFFTPSSSEVAVFWPFVSFCPQFAPTVHDCSCF